MADHHQVIKSNEINSSAPGDEEAFKEAKLRLMKIVSTTAESTEIITFPDPRKNPSSFFDGINMTSLSPEQLKIIRNQILYNVSHIDKRPWSSKGEYKLASGEIVLRSACTRRNKHSPKGVIQIVNRNRSKKCDCKAAFYMRANGCIRVICGSHVDECTEITEIELANCANIFRMGQSPTKQKRALDQVVQFLQNDESLKKKHVTRQLVGVLQEERVVVSKTSASSASSSPSEDAAETASAPLKPTNDDVLVRIHSVPPPLMYTTAIYRQAKKIIDSNVCARDSFGQLVKFLKENDEEFIYKIILEEDVSDDVVGGVKIAKSIHIHDKLIAPNSTHTTGKISVLLSDVTHGLSSPATGFHKWSFITAVMPNHEAKLCTYSGIINEDTATFMSEFLFLVELYPYLKHDKFVLLVDGDSAKIRAAKTVFLNCSLLLCLYHSTENVKQRFGAWLRTKPKQISSSSSNTAACTSAVSPALLPPSFRSFQSSFGGQQQENSTPVATDHQQHDSTTAADHDLIISRSITLEKESGIPSSSKMACGSRTYTRMCDICNHWVEMVNNSSYNKDSAISSPGGALFQSTFQCKDCHDESKMQLRLDGVEKRQKYLSSDNDCLGGFDENEKTTCTEDHSNDSHILPSEETKNIKESVSGYLRINENITNFLEGASDLNTITWSQLWGYVRKSPTFTILKDRLNQISARFPSSSSYLKFLWSTRNLWAKCAHSWALTFGFQSTSVQEGIHSSLKSCLDGNELSLHRLPAFFRKVMNKRYLRTAVSSSRKPYPSLRSDMRDQKGFKFLTDYAHQYLTDEGCYLLLTNLDMSFGYEAELYCKNTVYESTFEQRIFAARGHSAARFFCLLYKIAKEENNCVAIPPPEKFLVSTAGHHNDTSSASSSSASCAQPQRFLTKELVDCLPGQLFVVVSNKEEANKDLVYVSVEGNIASTCCYYPNWGCPGKVILALFHAGLIELNPVMHTHHAYHREFVSHLKEEVLEVIWCAKDRVMMEGSSSSKSSSNFIRRKQAMGGSRSMVSYDWCTLQSENEWEKIQQGGFETSFHDFSSTRPGEKKTADIAAASSFRTNGASASASNKIIIDADITCGALEAKKESTTERLRKEWYKLLPVLSSQETEREHFYVYLEQTKQRLADTARIQANSRRASLGLFNNCELRASVDDETEQKVILPICVTDGSKTRKKSAGEKPTRKTYNKKAATYNL